MEDIKEGVEIALYYKRESSTTALDPIKINKLAYLAIQKFNLEITFGWFKYGPAPVDTATRDGAKAGPELDLRPRPAREVSASDYSRVPSEEHDHPSPEAYSEWFLQSDEFEEILNTKTKQYLKEFYKEYAPERYKQLYLASIGFQRHLEPIEREAAEDPDRDFPSVDDQYYEDLSKNLNNVYGELLKSPPLEESVEPFNSYKRLLKDVIASASNEQNMPEQDMVFIGEVVEFFFTDAWRYVALLISEDTVRGANADRLRNSISSELANLRNQYDDDIGDLQSRAKLLGLLPTSKRVISKQKNPYEHDFEDESSTDNLEQWERLAAEVIDE